MPEAVAICTYCEKPVDPNSRTTFQRTSGWTQARRTGGGTHGLTQERRENEWCCTPCMTKLKSGVDPAQPSFL